MPNVMTSQDEGSRIIQHLPDSILLHILMNLDARDLLRASQVCKAWHRVAKDEFLWKDLFHLVWKTDKSIPMAPNKKSWLSEFKRLYFHTPMVESEKLNEHRDQVLHVSFSHNGELFATCSKDGYVKLWNAGRPASVKYYADMREFTWKYTQFSQFNESDTLLLVSGVHFGSNSTSGEIAVFNLVDGFDLQCRVLNKPYDIFGTWYNDSYLLSGNLHWMGHLTSCSVLWLNRASQALESEKQSVVMRLYKFHNINASSIRTIMIANCTDTVTTSNCQPAGVSTSDELHADSRCKKRKNSEEGGCENADTTHTICSHGKAKRSSSNSQKMQVFQDESHRLRLLEVDEESIQGDSTIEYNMQYRMAQTDMAEKINDDIEVDKDAVKGKPIPSCSASQHGSEGIKGTPGPVENNSNEADMLEVKENLDLSVFSNGDTNRIKHTSMPETDRQSRIPHCADLQKISECSSSSNESAERNLPEVTMAEGREQCHDSKFSCDKNKIKDLECEEGGSNWPTCFPLKHKNDEYHKKGLKNSLSASWSAPCLLSHSEASSMEDVSLSSNTTPKSSKENLKSDENSSQFPSSIKQSDIKGCSSSLPEKGDKYLIFTTGTKTYTPHQIGIKRIKCLEAEIDPSNLGDTDSIQLPSVAENLNNDNLLNQDFETVDHLVELDGHIIGMCLSPDNRYLYVNSRPWPQGYGIEDPLYPPPIAQEIDIHVIDLQTMHEVGTMHRAHKAYTPNDECFFIFLDVSDEYVASGAEDKHGYLWDRHYGVCLTKFPHDDVVNSVAFNPTDPEVLITASDDNSLKIWRSRNREKQAKDRMVTQLS